MKKALIIVESPAKIKTLRKFLGSNYTFESSVGHIRDLPKRGFGIDIQNDFEPEYVVLDDKKDVISRLKKAAKAADIVYLSPDPDREGEAIAWHILSILPPKTETKRVTFNAITKEAVLEALSHPRDIDQALVDAQQTRRLLDRIVGYKISPILTRRVQGKREGGLSAGRVQSVALKLVVDREKAIEAFKPVEYWSIEGLFKTLKDQHDLKASVISVDGKKVEKELIEGKDVYLISNEKIAKLIEARLEKSQFKVDSLDKKEKRRNPVAPFITSTLQQEASRHFGFSATRTMNIAQTLYEGVELGQDGSEGLITYMRTDSVRVVPEMITAVRKYIVNTYGKEYLPSEGRQFSTKKSAQDAHEAIRPSTLQHPPEKIERYLTSDQFKLYQLIWRRFVASQMNPAIYDTVSCDILASDHIMLRSTGSQLKFPGFLAVYEEREDKLLDAEKESSLLPPLTIGEPLNLQKVKTTQSFTKPPARFTEASLVKELEQLGIGRPSTYAAIMQKIQSRDYTTKEKGTIKPTELGRVIAKMLEDNFKQIMDVSFTANMEDSLEQIAENKVEWKALLKAFWNDFIPTVESAEKEAFVPKELTDLDCPQCQHKLQKIWSRNKYFYGCSNYPECAYTTAVEALDFNKEEYAPDFDWDQKCPQCQQGMKLRFGKFGPFLGCENYPKCRGIVNILKKDDPQMTSSTPCVAIGCDGKIVQRKSRFGKPFFSCSNYPACNVIVNHLDELSTKYVNHPKTPYIVSPKKGKKGKGASSSKGFVISDDLKSVVGDVSSRGDVTKKIWSYIKEHSLQDPQNKRKIVPDEQLAKVFGSKEPIDMMQLAKVLKPHFE
ncbi:type I DNA topoisomerase [Rhabdochlamydiaceae symbiont of Dictyostelium giganteum]|uniref:type I DNA topoisomerase n=1 Tax=Rhabdochlamydiaceae symbiont of Dictyostelium giganteum TaxID=3342349 RepID=UPI0038511295